MIFIGFAIRLTVVIVGPAILSYSDYLVDPVAF